jgi:capsular polysaccharide biosynthesis protein
LCEELSELETSASKTMRVPYNESICDPENTDTLINLSRTQSYRRRKATNEVLKPIHCSSTYNSNKPVLDGMWSHLVSEKSNDELYQTISKSKTCETKIIPKIVQKKVVEYQNTADNFTRSVMMLYNGGIMKKKKYKKLRKLNWEFMAGVKIPKHVSYDRLQAFITGIDKGEVKDMQVCICES